MSALKIAHGHGIAVTLLGGGSNVLVADTGVPGLVIRPRGGAIAKVDAQHVRADAAAHTPIARFRSARGYVAPIRARVRSDISGGHEDSQTNTLLKQQRCIGHIPFANTI